MPINNLPNIQNQRFDLEELGDGSKHVIQHAEQGPTYIRKDGQVAYVVLTEEVFNQIWPIEQKAFGVTELPKRLGELLDRGLDEALNKPPPNNKKQR